MDSRNTLNPLNPYGQSPSLVGLLNSQNFPYESYPTGVHFGDSQQSQISPFSSQETETPVGSKERKKWTAADDEVIISAWINTSKDPVVGSSQKGGTFWSRVGEYYAASPHAIQSAGICGATGNITENGGPWILKEDKDSRFPVGAPTFFPGNNGFPFLLGTLMHFEPKRSKPLSRERATARRSPNPRGFAAARTHAEASPPRGHTLRLRRRADTRCGIDVALASHQHREPTVGVHPDPPEHTDSTPSPPPNVFDRSEPNFEEHHSTNRDLIRHHSSQSPRGRLCGNHHR
ncbi:hypothetical protein DY000_02042546 [Brassica cretica]|uniref:Neprosin domain-containing protein n=1 Tax=Brassica cretica TaxID=69181 RepID=A0ABQ7BNM9_BRACR|nr:hypothetical protein DY000_02042546 [Brassica cretica]